MSGKRGKVTLFIIFGIVILILALMLKFGLQFEEPDSQTQNWAKPVDKYIETCMKQELQKGVNAISKGNGYILDTSNAEDGFTTLPLLMNSSVQVPVYFSDGTYYPVEVFPASPEKVQAGSDYPCYQSTYTGSNSCDEKSFTNILGFPFGAGATGEFNAKGLPHLSLHSNNKKDPFYLPHCKGDSCKYSIESQVRDLIEDDVRACVSDAKTFFKEQAINITYKKDFTINITALDSAFRLVISPDLKVSHGRIGGKDTFHRNSYMTKVNSDFAKMFVVSHGGSIGNVLNGQGIIEAESRDPDFILSRDGNDIIQNVFKFSPHQLGLTTEKIVHGSQIVSIVDKDTDDRLSFIVLNRAPFVNKLKPSKVELVDYGYKEVDEDFNPSLASRTSHPGVFFEIEYSFYLDGKDPDDIDRDGSLSDSLTVESLDMLGSKNTYEIQNIGSVAICNPKSRLCRFRIRYYDGYSTSDIINRNPSGQVMSASENKSFLYISDLNEGFPVGITISDSQGNKDYVEMDISADIHYEPGEIVDEEGNPADAKIVGATLAKAQGPPNFRQQWPWLLLPSVKRQPLSSVVYFYDEDKSCSIDSYYNPSRGIDMSDIGVEFLPNRIPTHYEEHSPGIFKALIELMLEEPAEDFGFDGCCPPKDVMEKMAARGICVHELCCLPVVPLGNNIRFVETGNSNNYYNTTECSYKDEFESYIEKPEQQKASYCSLENKYHQIGGDFYTTGTGMEVGEDPLVHEFEDLANSLANGSLRTQYIPSQEDLDSGLYDYEEDLDFGRIGTLESHMYNLGGGNAGIDGDYYINPTCDSRSKINNNCNYKPCPDKLNDHGVNPCIEESSILNRIEDSKSARTYEGRTPQLSNKVTEGFEGTFEEAGGTYKRLPLFFSPNRFHVRTNELEYIPEYESYYEEILSQVKTGANKGEIVSNTVVWQDKMDDLKKQGKGHELLDKFFEDEDMFGPGYTWWDYEEVIKECDDNYSKRTMWNGVDLPGGASDASGNPLQTWSPDMFDCVDEKQKEQLEDNGYVRIDNYRCDSDDFQNSTGELEDMKNFGNQGCCPNLKEALRDIKLEQAGKQNCTRDDCCFEPPAGRYFRQFDYSNWDPELFAQRPHSGYLLPDHIKDIARKPPEELTESEKAKYREFIDKCTPNGAGHLPDPDPDYDCGPTKHPTSADDSGGPYRSVDQYDRIFNYQFTLRGFYGGKQVGKRAGDTMKPGTGERESSAGVCSVNSKIHRCGTGGFNAYSPSYIKDFGIDPYDIGKDGECPSPEEAFKLMINGTCKIENCCLEIAPKGYGVKGAPGGWGLGQYGKQCPITLRKKIPPKDDVDVGEAPENKRASSKPKKRMVLSVSGGIG